MSVECRGIGLMCYWQNNLHKNTLKWIWDYLEFKLRWWWCHFTWVTDSEIRGVDLEGVGLCALACMRQKMFCSVTCLTLWEAPYDRLKIKRVDGSIVSEYDLKAWIILAWYLRRPPHQAHLSMTINMIQLNTVQFKVQSSGEELGDLLAEILQNGSQYSYTYYIWCKITQR